MRPKTYNFRLFATLSGFLLTLLLSSGHTATAQNDWNNVVPVVRQDKGRPPRTSRPKPKKRSPVVREQLRLLSVQWRILNVGANGSTTEVNPMTTFNPGDRLRLAVKTNQDGFLYIIHQGRADQPGQILFPDSRINSGRNNVKRGIEYIVPSGCPPEVPAAACSYAVNSASPQEQFTVVFSRDAMLELPKDATEITGEIKPEALMELGAKSGQRLSDPKTGDSDFSVRITNLNRNDNEEIIVPYTLRKRITTSMK